MRPASSESAVMVNKRILFELLESIETARRAGYSRRRNPPSCSGWTVDYAFGSIHPTDYPPLLLDHIPDLPSHIRSAEPRNRANSRRRGDVDLGEMAVDDVDADEQQSALAQRRAQRVADFALTRRKLGGLRGAAADHVGAQVIRRRNAVDRAGEFAVDQNDALVAVLDLGKKALDHPRLPKRHREHVEQRAEIHVLRHDAKHRRTAMAVQRLHHHRAVLVAERVDLV